MYVVQCNRHAPALVSRRGGWLVPYSGGAWGSLCQALSGPFLAAASISLQCQHASGTDHQPPNFVDAEFNLIALRWLALEFDGIFVFARRQIERWTVRIFDTSTGGNDNRFAVERNRSSSVIDVSKQNLRLSLLRHDSGFGNRAWIFHYKTYAGGVVLAAKLEHRRAIRR